MAYKMLHRPQMCFHSRSRAFESQPKEDQFYVGVDGSFSLTGDSFGAEHGAIQGPAELTSGLSSL